MLFLRSCLPQSTAEQDPLRRYCVADIVYDLDQLEQNDILSRLNEWDFPIFDLYNDMGDRILSQV